MRCALVLFPWVLALVLAFLLVNTMGSLRGDMDGIGAQTERLTKSTEEYRKSNEEFNATVRAFIDGKRAELETPPTDDDVRVFKMLAAANCMDPECAPDAGSRCGAWLIHWEHAHFREPGLDCLYNGGTVKTCVGACP